MFISYTESRKTWKKTSRVHLIKTNVKILEKYRPKIWKKSEWPESSVFVDLNTAFHKTDIIFCKTFIVSHI